MKIYSFSFFFQQEEELDDMVAVIDCRDLPDPEGLDVGEDGRTPSVQAYVTDNEAAQKKLDQAYALMERGFDVAFGCAAGKNRSVAMAELLSDRIGFPPPTHLCLQHWTIDYKPPA